MCINGRMSRSSTLYKQNVSIITDIWEIVVNGISEIKYKQDGKSLFLTNIPNLLTRLKCISHGTRISNAYRSMTL